MYVCSMPACEALLVLGQRLSTPVPVRKKSNDVVDPDLDYSCHLTKDKRTPSYSCDSADML